MVCVKRENTVWGGGG